MYNAKRVDEIRKRMEAATPGDWEVDIPKHYKEEYDDICIVSQGVYVCQMTYNGNAETKAHNVMEDAVFIANAKRDIAYLLGILETPYADMQRDNAKKRRDK